MQPYDSRALRSHANPSYTHEMKKKPRYFFWYTNLPKLYRWPSCGEKLRPLRPCRLPLPHPDEAGGVLLGAVVGASAPRQGACVFHHGPCFVESFPRLPSGLGEALYFRATVPFKSGLHCNGQSRDESKGGREGGWTGLSEQNEVALACGGVRTVEVLVNFKLPLCSNAVDASTTGRNTRLFVSCRVVMGLRLEVSHVLN